MRNGKHKVSYSEGSPTSQSKVVNKIARWSQLVDQLRVPMKTRETHAKYLALSQDERGRMKLLAGWICAATYRGSTRKKSQITGFGLLTFDLDNLTDAQFEELTDPARLHDLCQYEYVLHTTRSDQPGTGKRRCRVIFPLEATTSIDRYVAMVRHLARLVDPDMVAVDHVSFRPAQLMYRPSCAADQEYVFHHNEGEILDAHEFLAGIDGWDDFATLPRGASERVSHESAAKAEDPWEKDGIVGDFCRAYPSVEDAIRAYILDCYAPGDSHEDGNPRYTYLKGTGANGVVVYDDGRFIYSHHGTDPCGDRLSNAFDMVRLHLYGDADSAIHDDTLSITSMPSHKAMVARAAADERVKAEVVSRTLAIADDAFDAIEDPEDAEIVQDMPSMSERHTAPEIDDHRAILEGEVLPPEFPQKPRKPPSDWTTRLTLKANGSGVEVTAENVFIIVQNDPLLHGRIVFNELYARPAIRHPLESDRRGEVQIPNVSPLVAGGMRPLEDYDGLMITALLEFRPQSGGRGLKKVPREMIEKAIGLVALANKVNPVRDDLEACYAAWDGTTARLDTWISTYLGDEQNIYTGEAGRLIILAHVVRTFEPGHKFDYMPMLEGRQGQRKSSVIGALFREEWTAMLAHGFDDVNRLIETMEGKVAIEVADLHGFKGRDRDKIKALISAMSDKTRLAYARLAQEYPRRCILIGTTNDRTYLSDPTGNRRFWPIVVPDDLEIDTDAVAATRAQLMGEAMHIYKTMRAKQPRGTLPLYLSREAEAIRAQRAESRNLSDPADMLVAKAMRWVEAPIALSVFRDTCADPDEGEPLVVRLKTCMQEIAERALGLDLAQEGGRRTFNLISERLQIALKDWTRKRMRIPGYDRVDGFVRPCATPAEIQNGFRRVGTYLAEPTDEDDPLLALR